MAAIPNVLFLMNDHTNAQALAPHSQCLTPNLDSLAEDGVRFGRCYSTNAICSPARASLMTGTYPSTHGMWDCTHTQRTEWVNVLESLPYWSQYLAEAGYACGYFGKWHVEQSYRLENFGWHEYEHERSGKVYPQPPVIEDSEVILRNPGYTDFLLAATRDNGEDPPYHAHFDQGIDFIRRQTEADRNFCCFVSTCEPHDPYVPPKCFLDMYDTDKIQLPHSLHDDLADKPEAVQRMRAVTEQLTDNDWKKICAAYWATITYLDSEVGRIIELLKETGAYDNTIIVFTSDHGDMLGSHGLTCKGLGTAYEEVYGIPLIIRAPGIAECREENDVLTSLVDVGPTLLDLLGLKPIPNAHGRSLRPVLDNTADKNDWQDAYAEFFGQRFVYTQRVVWHDNWKYVFSPGGVDELYNLAEDLHEQKNLALDPAYRNTLVDMAKRMWCHMERIGDNSLIKTHYPTLRTAPVGPLKRESADSSGTDLLQRHTGSPGVALA